MQEILLALLLAVDRAGKSMDARMAMMAMTTKSSIKVNALCSENAGVLKDRLINVGICTT